MNALLAVLNAAVCIMFLCLHSHNHSTLSLVTSILFGLASVFQALAAANS